MSRYSVMIQNLERAINCINPFDMIERGLFWVMSKYTGGWLNITPQTMLPVQSMFYEDFKRSWYSGKPVRFRILKYRQGGISTIIMILYFAICITRHINALIIANTKPNSRYLFDLQRGFDKQIRERGLHDMPPRKTFSGDELSWEGIESIIRHGTARSLDIATTVPRGLIDLTEVARYDYLHTLLDMLTPSVGERPQTAIIQDTTAFGYGPFYLDYNREAKNPGSTGFENRFYGWLLDPHCREGVEYKKLDNTLEDYAHDVLVKIHGASQENINWFRKTIPGFRHNLEAFQQSYPATPEEAFIVGGNLVFDSIRKPLLEIAQSSPPTVFCDITFESGQARVNWGKGPVEIYEKPIPGEVYVAGSDVCEGLKEKDLAEIQAGGHPDAKKTYSTIVVKKARDRKTVCVVAVQYPPDVFADLGLGVCIYYNKALWVVEDNNKGTVVIRRALDVGYKNLYRRTTRQRSMYLKQTSEYGWHTGPSTRDQLLSDWERVVREDLDTVVSPRIAAEALSFVRNEAGKEVPKPGCFSDILFGAMLATQGINSLPHSI